MTHPMTARRTGALSGKSRLPGDKSISHRALIFASLASGRSHISGLLEADDVLHTAAACRAFGAEVERDGEGWVVDGGPWKAPSRAIYCGNAGTGVRLLMGAAAGQGLAVSFDGDESLRSRPMGRVLDPLSDMGVEGTAEDGKLPLSLLAGTPNTICYRLPKPSAQVKSAILLAGLGAQGTTIVEEPELCRDHTEKMLEAFGVPLTIESDGADGRLIHLNGPARLSPCDVSVPGDPSSAAFPVAAALIVPGSEVTAQGVLMNPQRIGLYETLQEMGADLTFENRREEGGEDVADLTARHSDKPLKPVTVPAQRAPAMIDEYPILAMVAAACCTGTVRMEGIGEMRVKESDRIAATEALLAANGVTTRSGPDWLEVDGLAGQSVPGGGTVVTHHDHRIAMSALCLGLVSEAPIRVDDASMIDTSFKEFVPLMKMLGADFQAG